MFVFIWSFGNGCSVIDNYKITNGKYPKSL